MIYCEGKNCSRRDQCAFHEHFEWKYPRQYLDQSTQGMGYEGIDKSGKPFSHHEFFCGDKADFYKHYKALGWREGVEYSKSLRPTQTYQIQLVQIVYKVILLIN